MPKACVVVGLSFVLLALVVRASLLLHAPGASQATFTPFGLFETGIFVAFVGLFAERLAQAQARLACSLALVVLLVPVSSYAALYQPRLALLQVPALWAGAGALAVLLWFR